MTIRPRLKPTYTPLHHRPALLTIDQRGFIYLFGLKLCRYLARDGVLEFQDHSRTRAQGRRFVEVRAVDLADELIRITESVASNR
jgi:hypothetical protein